MAASHFFRMEKIKGKNIILIAMRHNKRTLQADVGSDAHINVDKTHLNYALVGQDTPESIAMHARVQIAKAGIERLRKDVVMGVEVIFSLPVSRHSQDTVPFFKDCCEWVKKSFKGELLAFDVHLDEAAPHAHALILPLIDGRMRGSDLMGGIGNFSRLRNSFYTEVGINHGLSRGARRGLSLQDKRILEREVLMRLKSDSVLQSDVWAVVRDEIKKDPLTFANILSIKSPPRVSKRKFVDIAISKGRGSFV